MADTLTKLVLHAKTTLVAPGCYWLGICLCEFRAATATPQADYSHTTEQHNLQTYKLATQPQTSQFYNSTPSATRQLHIPTCKPQPQQASKPKVSKELQKSPRNP